MKLDEIYDPEDADTKWEAQNDNEEAAYKEWAITVYGDLPDIETDNISFEDWLEYNDADLRIEYDELDDDPYTSRGLSRSDFL